VCEDVDLLAEQQTGIEIMHVNGGAGERFNQVTLDRRQLTFPAEVLSDAPSDGIELLARFGPPVERKRNCGENAPETDVLGGSGMWDLAGLV